MKKTITNIMIIILLLLVSFEIITESNHIMETVNFSFNIWKNNIFPSLFPFFIISDLLINYGFVEFLGEVLRPVMHKLFKSSGSSSFILVMSIISGIPSNAKYVRELYDNNIIDENESTKILMFSHFSNPLFIIGTVSTLFLNNKEVGLLILLSHYITNIIIGIMFRNYYPTKEKYSKASFKNAIVKMQEKRINNKKSFGNIVSNSLINSINTLILILGVVTFFLIITTIIDRNLHISSYYQSILNGIFEITQGLKYVSMENIPLKLKATISVMILSFGGFSAHMQVMSILSDTNIKYLPYLTARILHAFISSLLLFLVFDFWFMGIHT